MSRPALDTAREGRFVFLLGTLVAIGPLAIDLYLPALPAIAAGLNASAEAVQASITVFLAGFSLGMLFYGPISDRYGRRLVMLIGLAFFIVASLGCMLAETAGQLVAARFLQALGGGAASILARTVVRDVYTQVEAIRKLSLMAMVTAIAPLIAPVLGSYLLQAFGWRGTFAAILCWGVMSLFLVVRFLPETLAPEARGQLSLGRAFGAYGHLLMDRQALGLVLANGMSFAAMFAYITGGAFYFIEVHHLSPTAYGVLFAANALGIFTANYSNSRLVRQQGAVRMAGFGCLAGLLGALMVAGATLSGDVMLAVVAGLFIVVSMTGLMGANCVGLLMARYPQNAGAAAALFGAAQFGLGTLASAAVSYYHDGTGRPMAWVVLAAMLASVGGYVLYRRSPV